MNLQEIKEDHAKELGYPDFETLFSECAHTGIDVFVNLIAMKYATEKIKEALKLASERVDVIYHDGTTKYESYHKQVNIGSNHIRPNRGGIIALGVELIEQINKEI